MSRCRHCWHCSSPCSRRSSQKGPWNIDVLRHKIQLQGFFHLKTSVFFLHQASPRKRSSPKNDSIFRNAVKTWRRVSMRFGHGEVWTVVRRLSSKQISHTAWRVDVQIPKSSWLDDRPILRNPVEWISKVRNFDIRSFWIDLKISEVGG